MREYKNKFNPRFWSNKELAFICKKLPFGMNIINVAGWKDQDKEGGFYKEYFNNPSSYHISNYDKDHVRGSVVTTDINLDLNIPIPAELCDSYDLVMTHTVLEHLENPVFSFEQLSKITNDLIITIVPFKQKYHFEEGMFGDYYRFTPHIMRKLHQDNGFEVVYEAFTPSPSLDVYLIYLGSKNPNLYKNKFPELIEINLLNQKIGSFNAMDLLKNIVYRFLDKYSNL